MWIVIAMFIFIAGIGVQDISVKQHKLEKQNMILQAKVKKVGKKNPIKITKLDGIEITNLEA